MNLALLLLLSPAAIRDITFVRHGETVANATGKYNTRTLNTFSSKGKAGVAALTKRLVAQPPYDLILVSPAERTLRTIAPYLRQTHRRATIWPLLYECCTGKRTAEVGHPPLKFGPKIKIPADLSGLFTLDAGHDRLPEAPSFAQGLVQVKACLAEFKRYEGKRILLVGHSGHGGQFIHALTGRWIKIENTKEISFAFKG